MEWIEKVCPGFGTIIQNEGAHADTTSRTPQQVLYSDASSQSTLQLQTLSSTSILVKGMAAGFYTFSPVFHCPCVVSTFCLHDASCPAWAFGWDSGKVSKYLCWHTFLSFGILQKRNHMTCSLARVAFTAVGGGAGVKCKTASESLAGALLRRETQWQCFGLCCMLGSSAPRKSRPQEHASLLWAGLQF